MIHHKSMESVMIEDVGSKNKKLKNIEVALEKIARIVGEDYYESVFILEDEINIKIKLEEIKELMGRNIWIWVIIPYHEEILALLKQRLSKLNLPLLDYLKILNFNNKKFVKYPERVEICRVNKEIFEILKEEHSITSNYFKCYEWIQIQNTKTWIKAQIQIARELIADKLLKKY